MNYHHQEPAVQVLTRTLEKHPSSLTSTTGALQLADLRFSPAPLHAQGDQSSRVLAKHPTPSFTPDQLLRTEAAKKIHLK